MAMVNTRTKRINQSDHGGNIMPRYTCPVKIRGVLYNSQKEAAEAIGVTQSAIYRALVNGTLEKCGIHNRNRKPVTIRGVHYESQTAAAKALGLRQTNIAKAVRNGNLKGIGLGRNATTKRKTWVDGIAYDSQAAAEASADTIRNIWGGLMGFLATPPTVTTGSEVIDLLA